MSFRMPRNESWKSDAFQDNAKKKRFKKSVSSKRKSFCFRKDKKEDNDKNSNSESFYVRKKRKLSEHGTQKADTELTEKWIVKKLSVKPKNKKVDFLRSNIVIDNNSLRSPDSFSKKLKKVNKKNKYKKLKLENPESISKKIKTVSNSNLKIQVGNMSNVKARGNKYPRNISMHVNISNKNNTSRKVTKSEINEMYSQKKTLKGTPDRNSVECLQALKKKKKKKKVIRNSFDLNHNVERNISKSIIQHQHETVKCLSNQDNLRKFVPVKKASTFKSSIIDKAREHLQAAKFRFLNEKFYTVSGDEAFKFFQSNSDEFKEYHQGYELQVKKWPVNPVDIIISDLRSKPKNLVIADMGCGDAKIARTFPKQVIHSFDIIALNENVTCCNITKVPLANGSVDIVVFCLSLMGINLGDYILEASRILKKGGLLKIAEIESRIDDLRTIIKKIENYGFSLKQEDASHSLFVFLDFIKVKKKRKNDDFPSISLKPCLYKKR